MSVTASRRFVALGLGLASMGCAAAVTAAPAQADPTAPHPQRVTCTHAGFYENYDSSIHQPVNQIDLKDQDQTVGHTEGVHAVYDNAYARAFDWSLGKWGVIRTDCITHEPGA